jgi:hypothetical protein
LIREKNKAIAFIPELLAHKIITHGLVLPEGYEVVPHSLWFSNEHQALGVVIESYDLPHSSPGTQLPNVFIKDMGSHIAVEEFVG